MRFSWCGIEKQETMPSLSECRKARCMSQPGHPVEGRRLGSSAVYSRRQGPQTLWIGTLQLLSCLGRHYMWQSFSYLPHIKFTSLKSWIIFNVGLTFFLHAQRQVFCFFLLRNPVTFIYYHLQSLIETVSKHLWAKKEAMEVGTSSVWYEPEDANTQWGKSEKAQQGEKGRAVSQMETARQIPRGERLW